MTDARSFDDTEDRLPWLEAVEQDDEPAGPSTAKLVVAVLIGLAVIGLVIGGLYWLANRDAPAAGEGGLIAAPEGDYKVKPENPGGMQVEGEGDTAFAASEGAEPNARLNVDAIPETPVAKAPAPVEQPKAAPVPARQSPPAQKPAPATRAPQQQPQARPATPAPTGASGSIQLGAFSTQAAANNAWRALSGRFSYLSPLTQSIVPVETGGRTLYRLRASGPGAAGVCRRLTVAGESCVVLN